MRIHTNVIGYTQQIRNALQAEKDAGRIAQHVTFKALTAHRSNSHRYAYEIQLEAAIRDNGRRAGNSGAYGAMQPEVDGYAATFDEWGWLLAALYEIDPHMIAGTLKTPIYADRVDFDYRTAFTYNPRELAATIREFGDPFPYVSGQAAHTKRGYLEGRRGAGRVHYSAARAWNPHKPRTVAEVLEFAHLSPVEA
jgi:hypothetical protein